MLRLTISELVDWICVMMIILGTLGNSLGLIVFSSRKFRRTSYGRLAIASLIINLLCVFRYSLLLHSETRRWITYKAAQSWFNCKLYRFSSCLRILSAFVTVAWTYERFSYVTTNFHFSSVDQLKNKVKFLLMATLSLLLITALTGPTVYFYRPKSVFSSSGHSLGNTSFFRSLAVPAQRKGKDWRRWVRGALMREWRRRTLSSSYLSLGLSLFAGGGMFSWEERCSLRRCLFRLVNVNVSSGSSVEGVLPVSRSSPLICGLKDSISSSWRSFLLDVRFGLNYTTFRSIFSEMIPSILVICFNIGIIFRVVQSRLTFSSTKNTSSTSAGSFRCPEGVDGLMVHNRPRTSWMNVVLIIHSCLFFFSSLTATIVHWSTSDALLSYGISVVILANCSLNFYVYCLSGQSFRREINKLFYDYFQLYFWTKFLNLFRSKAEQEEVAQTVRMRLVRNRSANLPPHCRTPSVNRT